MQIQTTLAVVVACIPAYKLFMDRASSGMMGISFEGREGTYQLSSINKSGKSGENSKDSKKGSREANEPYSHPKTGYHAAISASDIQPSQSERAPRRTMSWEVYHGDEIRLNPRGGRLPSEDSYPEHDQS